MTRAIRSTLTTRQNFELCKFIESEYLKLNIPVKAFTTHASEKLGFELKESHVYNRLKELGYEVNKSLKTDTNSKLLELQERIEVLEKRMNFMEKLTKAA